ncbi:hypothetical protein HELRODRAFT_80892, partial [Helobdella robusta]|uniref:Cytochrome P450 n=1 Tax=Helobdella robusta TaxID=6412 RepID=T1G468_HELRO
RYVVVLNGRKTIHEALVKHSLNFSSRPLLYLDGIVNPNRILKYPYDDHFKTHHKISLNILKHFGFRQGIMESRIKIEVEDLVERIKNKNGQAFNPSFEITAAVSNVICSIIFGKGWSKDDPEFHKGLKILHSMISGSDDVLIINFFPVFRYLNYYKKFVNHEKELFNNWDCYIEKVIYRVLNNKKFENFCTMYLEETNNSNKDIFEKDQFTNTIRDLFIAGTETTATTLLWLILIMANNPDVQKKVQEEMDRVVGSKRLSSLEDKPNLPITEAFILELMRFKTLVPLALPHWTIKETVIDGLLIPKNVMVLPNIYSAHMSPTDWEEPEKFKIERFLNEDETQVIKRDAIIPFFLGGKRACLGEILAKQEIFLFAVTLLQKFKMLPKEDEVRGITTSPSPFEARLVYRD